MLRITKIRNLFSDFHHPCRLKLDVSSLQNQTCRLHHYISTYRKYGHHYAKLDPLGLYYNESTQFVRPTDLGIKFSDTISQFKYQSSPIIKQSRNIEDLENKLRKVYQQSTGVEFQHLQSLEEKNWLYQNYQRIMIAELTHQTKKEIAKVLVEAEALDLFLHKKFVTFKRYSGQGAESTVVALNQLFNKSSQMGYDQIVFGMPHRGRINTLTNILNYPPRSLFRKISGKTDTPAQLSTIIDDVTSHIAQSLTKSLHSPTKITLVHNPSHLQAQNPVSMGKTHSKQQYHSKDKVMNIQVHGDAAICAQGIVYESFCVGKVPKFDIDGTIHIITNNQLGYTTRPIDSRGSKYCTDVAKGFDTPVIHVNSENIQDVHKVMDFCVEYKRKFKKDIMVDLICYRKYGHNQVDEPQFTQPKMYNKIRKQLKSNPKKYPQHLASLGIVPSTFYQQVKQSLDKFLQSQYQQSLTLAPTSLASYTNAKSLSSHAFTQQWLKYVPSLYGQEYSTGFDIKMLKEFGLTSVSYPEGFNLHPRIKKYHVDQRVKTLEQGLNLNWATCEALALFSLSFQGYNVRFTGQDVERGTFSQRHINLTDQKTQKTYNSLEEFSKMQPGRGEVQVFNSPLSQNAVLSYEYGYSLDHPHNMTIWQAQFGDFFNTAQVAIDTFLTNSENKWMRQTGLTLILPHGFDGAGPQHSSCRIQRFLQLANSDGKISSKKLQSDKSTPLTMNSPYFWQDIQSANFSLVFPTKPANMYHVLRRQMKRNFRKPLVVAGPKGLLREKACTSRLQDMGPGTKFQKLLKYRNVQNIQQCQHVLLCSGKFVYDIDHLLAQAKAEKTALMTIEQLFPFPQTQLKEILSKCSKKAKIFWVQQENLNSGAFDFVYPRLVRIARELGLNDSIEYVGRRALATTAVGSSELHKKESTELSEWIKKLIL